VKSNVNAAVLSLVIEQPSDGASVCRRFETRYHGLLSTGRQHIYNALSQLVKSGMLERIPLELVELDPDDVEGLGRTPAGFRATASGARGYRGWLTEPVEPSKLSRHDTLIRLASTSPNDRASALALLDRYERVMLELAQQTPLEVGNLMDELVADERASFAQAELRWIQRTRDKLGDGC
jgi:DNA-binding PadR family transcriptional regulator